MLDRYDDDGRFAFGDGRRVAIVFCIDASAGQHLLESPLSADQQVEAVEGGYQISATVVDLAQLRWWLPGFGPAVHVLEPAGLLEA